LTETNRRAKLRRVNARFEIGAQTGMDSKEHGGRPAEMGVLLKKQTTFSPPRPSPGGNPALFDFNDFRSKFLGQLPGILVCHLLSKFYQSAF
jgi:hypothetical protein